MDAVNGNQLWGVQDQLNQLGNRVTNIENGTTPVPVPGEPDQPGTGDPGTHFASSGDPGNAAVASGSSSVATGEGAQAIGVNSSAVGSGSVAAGNNSVAIGSGAQSTADNAVALGQGSVADRANSVSVGSVGNERQVTNVAAGTAPTDAANVAQLNEVRDWAQTYTDQRIGSLSNRVEDVHRQASAGTASAIAMANLPQAYAPA